MKISVICFSLTGQETGLRLCEGLSAGGHQVRLYKKSRYLSDSITESTKDWAEKQFPERDALIFVGACGIAVRSIAGCVEGKKSDPAVLVTDECGEFVISLLSGHLGGANALTAEASEILQAVPVVTTATDLHRLFAVDVFARENHCGIFNMTAAKEVSAALLAGEPTGFYSEFPMDGELPRGLVLCDANGDAVSGGMHPATGTAVTVHKKIRPFSSTALVVPKVVSLGIGCRKGRAGEALLAAVERSLEEFGLHRAAVEKLASITLKKEEPGILALARELQVPFITYEEEELSALEGEFTSSEFVRQVTGVDNVCERSAVLASGGGTLIQKKQGAGGVTTALAIKDWRLHFE